MNTFRKIKHNAKALSPVVASIILIAVTVAVSVAVAAWMGGMTLGFMQTEQLTVNNPTFDTATNVATIDVTNAGTQAVVITKVTINGIDVTADASITAPYTLKENTPVTITITAPAGITLTAGNNYLFAVATSKGNQFSYSAIAPQ